jgi:hypothetical protein
MAAVGEVTWSMTAKRVRAVAALAIRSTMSSSAGRGSGICATTAVAPAASHLRLIAFRTAGYA